MAVGLVTPQNIAPVAGVRLAACRSGLKADTDKTDLVLIELVPASTVAAVFTRNRFCAAPVILAREHLADSAAIRYLLINAGNANAGTGQAGLDNARACCTALANAVGVEATQVLPFSTGVIGQALPVDRIQNALPRLLDDLDEAHWVDAARAIMTTDTQPKAFSRQLEIDGQTVTISGIAKGSGMIKPDMATMLAYVATDAAIPRALLASLLQAAVELSFNSITVDGDTSTNDACVLIATGCSGVEIGEAQEDFVDALNEVMILLAQAIIRDGEGASKFVEIAVESAATPEDARTLAYTVAHSPLVKTALFASDANWGRILAAIGRAPLSTLDIERIDLYLGDTCLFRDGAPDPGYSEAQGQAEMERAEIRIRIHLNAGNASTRVWTTDLSHEYVTINAEYRS